MVKSGDVVRVKVLDVDIPRKRISLTLRLDTETAGNGGRKGGPDGAARDDRQGGRRGQPRQNPSRQNQSRQNQGGQTQGGQNQDGRAGSGRGNGRGSGGAPLGGAMAEALRRAGLTDPGSGDRRSR